MTPEERAAELARRFFDDLYPQWEDGRLAGVRLSDVLEGLIAAAVREAVAAEREACAELALKIGPDATDPDGPWHDIATAIRARKDA
jgi:hypothetical protein